MLRSRNQNIGDGIFQFGESGRCAFSNGDVKSVVLEVVVQQQGKRRHYP